jgi:hypothetical protein
VADAVRIGILRGADGDVRLDVVRRRVPGAPTHAYSLELQLFKKGPRPRAQAAELGAAELPALLEALGLMGKRSGESEPSAAAAPVGYRSGGVSVGLSPDSAERSFFVQVGARNPARLVFHVDHLDEMTGYVRQAAARIRDLERDERKRRELRQ